MDDSTVGFVTAMLCMGSNGPGKTLGLLWDVIFGPANQRLQKILDDRQQNLTDFGNEIIKEVYNIPNENIVEEVDISIIGPALEASKYYIDKKEIRILFAKLIGASMDTRRKNEVHHSFVDIIKQLSPTDALLLSKINYNGPVATIRIQGKDEGYYNLYNGIRDIVLIDGFVSTYKKEFSVSINNLDRLGLVDLSRVISLSEESYSLYYKLDEYKEALVLAKGLNKEVHYDKYMYEITPFGQIFKDICLQYD